MPLIPVNKFMVAWSVCLVSICHARVGRDVGLSPPSGGSPGISADARSGADTIAPARGDSLRAFFVELAKAMVPLRDSLESRFAAMRRIPDLRSRDSAIEDLGSRWGEVELTGLAPFWDREEFYSIVSPGSTASVDSVSLAKLRRVLATGGMSLDFQEGYGIVPDLGARPDLLASTASPSLAERLRLDHQGLPTLVFSDAGIVSPLDTVIGRIQGWEAFARRYSGTADASKARRIAKRYLASLVCGDQNTPAFQDDRPDPGFLRAWRRLSKGADGPSRRWIREWLSFMASEKWRYTPRTSTWLARQEMNPCLGSSEER